jgi:hypothetical protein
MIELKKISSLLFAVFLFYLSVSATFGYFLPDSDLQQGNNHDTPTLWYAEAPNLSNLTKPFRSHLKSVKNLSLFNLKDFYNDNRSSISLAEQNPLNTNNEYLAHAKSFCPRPEVRTIIFPFHYFL